MSEQTLTIIKSNGEKFIVSSNEDMRVLTFLPSSPFFNTQYEKIPGRHGEIDVGGSFDARDNIKSRIFFRSKGIHDFYLFRNEIFKLFASQEPFYIITNREPGKRWNVRVASKYEAEPKGNGHYGVFDIVFKSASAFVESVGTTLDTLTFDSDLWQIGQGLITEDLVYRHSTTNFQIFNAGDEEIDPRSFPLLITFTGASTNLKIQNKTTGDEWLYNGVTASNDIIRLDGIRSTKNSLSIFRDTNRKLISIKPGWNDFEITGATSHFSISFDFRFYYL